MWACFICFKNDSTLIMNKCCDCLRFRIFFNLLSLTFAYRTQLDSKSPYGWTNKYTYPFYDSE